MGGKGGSFKNLRGEVRFQFAKAGELDRAVSSASADTASRVGYGVLMRQSFDRTSFNPRDSVANHAYTAPTEIVESSLGFEGSRKRPRI